MFNVLLFLFWLMRAVFIHDEREDSWSKRFSEESEVTMEGPWESDFLFGKSWSLGSDPSECYFSDSVTVTCWISPSSILVYYTLFFFGWSCGSIQVFEAHIHIHFCSSIHGLICCLFSSYIYELTSFFVFMWKAVRVLSSDGRFELSKITETNDKANDKLTDLYLTQAASVFPYDIMTGMNYVLNLLIQAFAIFTYRNISVFRYVHEWDFIYLGGKLSKNTEEVKDQCTIRSDPFLGQDSVNQWSPSIWIAHNEGCYFWQIQECPIKTLNK